MIEDIEKMGILTGVSADQYLMAKFAGKKKKLLLIPLLAAVVVGGLVFFVLRSKYECFDGIVVGEKDEVYFAEPELFLLYSPLKEVPYCVKRILVKADRRSALDLALFPCDQNVSLLGKRVKGKFSQGSKIELEGGRLNFGIFRTPGAEIELWDKPTGVIKEFSIVQ